MYLAIKVALPKSGITSSITTDVRDGPHLCGGAGLLPMYHYQGTSRTFMILEQLNRSTPTSHLAKICLEDLIKNICTENGLLCNHLPHQT